jgi:hypothetical protein
MGGLTLICCARASYAELDPGTTQSAHEPLFGYQKHCDLSDFTGKVSLAGDNCIRPSRWLHELRGIRGFLHKKKGLEHYRKRQYSLTIAPKSRASPYCERL